MKYVGDAILVCALILAVLLIADIGLSVARRWRGRNQ
jgi:hypothetical protein